MRAATLRKFMRIEDDMIRAAMPRTALVDPAPVFRPWPLMHSRRPAPPPPSFKFADIFPDAVKAR